MKAIILILFCFAIIPSVNAQRSSGVVSDANGPIPGVTITAAATNASTISDMNGNFSIEVASGTMLTFSYIGYGSVIVEATQAPMSVVLQEVDTQLDEVVVIGYGVRKKVDNTGAINQIKGEEITRLKVLNPVQGIQGKAAGVQIIASDTPGGASSLIIRGVGTVRGASGPLYVVDGVPATSISNINSNDILTVDILKDASSLAIYGNRAANGVVIITTKKGRGEGTTFEFESFVGVRKPIKKVEMANAAQFVAYSNTALNSNTFAQIQPNDTDWFDEITRTGLYTQQNLSMYGSTERLKFLTSVSSYDEQGILNGLDYNRLTFRTNNEYKVADKFTITQTLSAAFARVSPKPLSAFTSAYKQSPILPVRYPSGQYSASILGADGTPGLTGTLFNNVGNPVAQLDFFTERQKDLVLQGSISGEYNITKQLKFTSRVGVQYNTFKSYSYTPNREIWLAADPLRDEEGYSANDPINTLVTTRRDSFNWNWDNFITYNHVFDEIHDLEVTLGTTSEVLGGEETLAATGRNVPEQSNYWNLNLSSSPDATTVDHRITPDRKWNSYFGRFQYKLMDRYLLTGTFRRDGSSQFQENNRWGNFPSFGVGWIISNEAFLKDSKTVNLLKLRGGWGRLGNAFVPLNRQVFNTGISLGYAFGDNLSTGTTALERVELNNWETTEETTIGLDFGMFNNRLTGTLDVYDKQTIDAFLLFAPALSTGLNPTVAQVGNISNRGAEITLQWSSKFSENFKYWFGGNYSYNENELVKITNPLYQRTQGGTLGNGQYTKRLEEGQPIGSFYLFETDGFDANGDLQFKDLNGDGAIDNDDRRYFGSSLPKSFFGFNFGATYKNWDFAVDAYGTAGGKVYNGKRAQRFGNENIEAEIGADFYTSLNTGAEHPAPSNDVPIASNYFLESGDYIRINNITLGYTVPGNIKHISSLRVYVNAINPFIFQKFSGFSPELNRDGDPMGGQGIELDAYPSLSSFVFGINLKF